MRTSKIAISLVLLTGFAGALVLPVSAAVSQQTTTEHKPANMVVGMVVAMHEKTLTIKPDSGAPVTVSVSDTARILRTEPGAKTIAGATPIPLSGISVGDRVLVALHPAPNGSGQVATTVVAMKRSDVVRQQLEEKADWQARGAGGIVKSVDPATGTVTILSLRRTIAIRTTPKTVIRRYSPISIRYSDAKLSTLAQIHPGDQLRVLGTRSADGNSIEAEKIVSGSFRNIAGTVVSVDAANGSIIVADAATKKPFVVHVTADTQMHTLPPQMAKLLAARFKERKHNRSRENASAKENASSSNTQNGGQGFSLSQILQRAPVIQLSDLRKGDSVMIVANQGAPNDVIAYTLLNGVGAFLNGSSAGANNLFSASWSLGGQGGGQSSGEAPPTNH